MFAGDLQDKHPYLYNQGVWIFDNWDKALRAAGFDPDKMRMSQFWDRQKIIKKLHNMRDRNLPLYARYMLKNHTALFSSSRRELDPGIMRYVLQITRQVSTTLHKSRLGTLRSLRDVVETRSRAAIPAVLRSQAAYYFGSLRKALAIAPLRFLDIDGGNDDIGCFTFPVEYETRFHRFESWFQHLLETLDPFTRVDEERAEAADGRRRLGS